MESIVTVIKRDGTREPFEPEKISQVVQAAGLRPVDAEQLSENVAKWVKAKNFKELTSLQVRDRVFQELEKMDKYASGLYAWYQNLKDKKYTEKKPS